MKKLLVAITLFSYLAVSGGVVINFHYCMNRLSSVGLFASEKNTCGKCGMHKKGSHGCCHDEVKVIKMKDDQQKAQAIQLLQAPEQFVSIPSAFIVIPFYNSDQSIQRSGHSPPLLGSPDTYLQNCVFRI